MPSEYRTRAPWPDANLNAAYATKFSSRLGRARTARKCAKRRVYLKLLFCVLFFDVLVAVAVVISELTQKDGGGKKTANLV